MAKTAQTPPARRIHPGSAFDLEHYQLKGDYTMNTGQTSARATANRQRMLQSDDPAQRAMAQGTVPGMGTPVPIHMLRPARKKGG